MRKPHIITTLLRRAGGGCLPLLAAVAVLATSASLNGRADAQEQVQTPLSALEATFPSNPFVELPAEDLLVDVAQYEQFAPQPSVVAQPYAGRPSGGGDPFLSSGYPAEYQGNEGYFGGVTPVNWISGPYLKAGTAVLLNDDLLGDSVPGYSISGGYRQPLGPAADNHLFVDLGGSYYSVFGESTRFVAGRGTDFNGNVIITPNLYFTTLNEIQRMGAHFALGWYWGAPVDNAADGPEWRLATRLGGRAGHFRGKFEDIPSPASFGTTPFYERTDTFGGVLLGAEALWLLHRSQYCDVKWSFDLELANDWLNFSDFESGSMTTVSVMLGFMLSR